jgi:hypothetical protein
MRTIVDIPNVQLLAVDRLCKRLNISRAEAVRRGLGAFIEQNTAVDTHGFGLWKERASDRAAPAERTRTRR